MIGSGTIAAEKADVRDLDPWAILNAMAAPILVVRRDHGVVYANAEAEQFLAASVGFIRRRRLTDFLPADSPLFALIDQVFRTGSMVGEYGVTLDSPRIGNRFVSLFVAPMIEDPDLVVVTVHEQGIARKIDHQLTHRGAARSVTAMAAMLAHEVKNPLSGIRGAAQLLEPGLSSEDRSLTQLICDETDRICALVDRMEVFSDRRPIERTALNIHEVLEHVRAIATHGFAKGILIREDYDPSLPPVLGNRDQLVQLFLNLVKNAAEAVPAEQGEIVLSTAYRHGVRLAVPASDTRIHLPLIVSVQDNGDGIPEELQEHLFDPFVTSKASGSGLGLALVAKLVDAHGGVIEFSSEYRRTVFNVMLPVHQPEEGRP